MDGGGPQGGADGQSGGPRPSNKRLQQTQAQVDEVVGIMKVNVEKVLERDQKLSQLDDRADALQEGASQFEKSAATLKRKYWWKNIKMIIIMCAIVILLVILIVVWAGDRNMERSLFTDNTALFRARVKAIKLRQLTAAKQRSKSPSESDSITEKTSDNVVTEAPKVEEEPVLVSANFHLYTAHARQIGQHIRELADLVVERRKSYLLSTVSAYGHDELMSDADRRHFDSDTDLAMRQCSKLVRNLEFQVDNDPSLRKDDEHPHLKAITLLLNVYLKNVCKIVSEIRALYLKKSQHLNRICRLGNLVNMYAPKIEGLRAGVEAKREELKRRQIEMERQLKEERAHPSESESIGPMKREERTLEKKMEPKKEIPVDVPVVDVSHFDDEQNENEKPTTPLNSTEQAQLTIENQQLLERLVQRNSEIEQIESQFSELQKLQQTFVEKIVEQEKDIEIIHQKTIHTLDNLDQANQFIRDAIKNSASRRVIALFCLIVLTFTLLFLDWYNP